MLLSPQFSLGRITHQTFVVSMMATEARCPTPVPSRHCGLDQQLRAATCSTPTVRLRGYGLRAGRQPNVLKHSCCMPEDMDSAAGAEVSFCMRYWFNISNALRHKAEIETALEKRKSETGSVMPISANMSTWIQRIQNDSMIQGLSARVCQRLSTR